MRCEIVLIMFLDSKQTTVERRPNKPGTGSRGIRCKATGSTEGFRTSIVLLLFYFNCETTTVFVHAGGVLAAVNDARLIHNLARRIDVL